MNSCALLLSFFSATILFVSVDGFSKDKLILTARCGQTLTADFGGNMTYPEDFPRRPYPFGLKCRWLLKSPNPDVKVEVRLPYLVLRNVDYMVLMDGKLADVAGQRPCQDKIYQKLLSTSPLTSVQLIRGVSITGNDHISNGELTFLSASNSVQLDFCPSAFPLATVRGLGFIVLWEDHVSLL
ncbi:hypothetical protein RvY_03361 [Ramazzottius varieornatus]|uniref:CUB domain-containing protein n=1 Tax=Ramazzottius varieornatus TaxID=947166 RepID=A0A1D1UR72_RAMVA|nr:hypothetical protein RvY_03361 [Ramazzottius varieornatus]